MTIQLRLDPEVQDIAIALGIAKRASGGVVLDEGFFTAPWDRIGSIFTNDAQRAALVSALESLLRRAEPVLLEAVGATSKRSAFPLIEEGKPGQVYIVLMRRGAAPSAPLLLSVMAEVQAANQGPGVMGEVTLLRAAGGHIDPVAGSRDFPLRIEASAPVSAHGARLVAALKIVAPPDHANSRLNLRIDGLAHESAPIEFDLSAAQPPIARLAALLLDLLLAQIDPQAPPAVQRVAAALPVLLGLAGDLPPLPLQELAHDPSAMPRWIAQLVTSRTAAGDSALVRWFEAIGRMLGAEPMVAPLPRGDASDPAVLTLLAGAPGMPFVALTAGVRTEISNGSKVLVVGVRVGLDAPFANAQIHAEAAMLAVPLDGQSPVRVLEQLDLRLQAPATGGWLVDPADTGGSVSVRALRAGLRLRTTGAQPVVEPALEFDDVTVDLAGHASHFARLDFTDANALTGAAQTLLFDAIEEGLGSGAPIVEALRTLLGLGTTPALDLVRFTSAPTQAIAGYYRALRSGSDGWKPVLRAVGALLGNAADAEVRGSGAREDPWTVDLALFGALAESPFALQLALWDAGNAATPRLVLALQAGASMSAWDARVAIGLFEATLPETGEGHVGWLGGVHAFARVDPPALQPGTGSLALDARAIRLEAAWALGSPLTVQVRIEEVTVLDNEERIELGTLALPLAAPLDLARPDLGLGLDPEALWESLRLLIARAADSWGGPDLRALLSLIGIVGPGGLGAATAALRNPSGAHLGAALREPLALLRRWLVDQLAQGSDALDDIGSPFIENLLRAVQGLLLGDSASTRAPGGHGSLDDPWVIALDDTPGSPAALTFWAEPYGVPRSWSGPAFERLCTEQLSAPELIEAVQTMCRHAPWLAGALFGRDPAEASRQIERLSAALSDGDGLLPADLSTPESGWQIGVPVVAAHHRITREADAVAQVRARVADWVAASSQPLAVLLLAPRFAGVDAWDALLSDVDATRRSAITLRVPGVPPQLVDLAGVVDVTWYCVDLADDGNISRSDSAAALERVVAAVRRAKPGARVVLVAHSYLGMVAEACAAAHGDAIAGVIALAAPLGVGRPINFTDIALAEAVRLARTLVQDESEAAASPLAQALAFAASLLEGRAPGTDGVSLQPLALPTSVWLRGTATAPSLGSVPGVSIAAGLDAGLCDVIGVAVAAAVGNLTTAVPTRFGWGVQLALPLPAPAPGEAQIDARLGLKLGELDLASAASSAQPGWIDFRARLSRPDGWLVGSSNGGSAPDARIRWAEVVGIAVPGPNGLRLDVGLRLHDVSLRGSAAAFVDLDDPLAPELLDTLVRTLDAGPVRGGCVDTFLELLADIGIVRRKTGTVAAGVLADGLQRLRTDASQWLGARLPALIDRPAGWFGLRRDSSTLPGGGPWCVAFAPLPIELVVEPQPWRVTVRTTGTGLPIGRIGRFTGCGTVRLGQAQPEVAARLTVGGLGLECAGPGAPLLLAGSWLEQPIVLHPADPDVLGATLAQQVPALLVNTALGLLIEQGVEGGMRVGSLQGLLRNPGRWMAEAMSAGANGLMLPVRVNQLLAMLARAAGFPTSATQPLQLPRGFVVSASNPAGADPLLRLTLDCATPVTIGQLDGEDATLDLDLRLDIDALRQVRPGGELVLRLPLPGAATWGAIELRLGADVNGLRLAVATDSGVQLTLLPQVSGLDTLVSAAGRQLLPAALDAIVGAVDDLPQRPAALDDVLAVATAMGIHDGTAAIGSGFAARGAQIASFVDDLAAGRLQTLAAAIGPALATLLQRLFGANIAPTPPAPGRIGLQIGGVLGGSIALEADFDSHPVDLRVRAQAVGFGAVHADLDLGVSSAQLLAAVDLMVSIDTGTGLVLTPRVSAGLAVAGAARLDVKLRPLGDDRIVIPLAPTPVPPTPQDILRLAEAWLIPLAGTLLLRAAAPILDTKLWSTSTKSIADLLLSSELALRDSAGLLALKTPLPSPPYILRGILDAFGGTEVPLPGQFALRILSDAHRYGVALRGAPRFDIGDYALTLHLGLPPRLDSVWGEAGRGVGLLLLDLTTPTSPTVSPVLRLGGLGAKFGRKLPAKPLVDAGGFRLGAVGTFVQADIALTGAHAPSLVGGIHGAIEADGLGLLIAPGSNSGNPVAASLVQPSGGGDQAPANPPFDMLVATTPAGLAVKFSGEPRLRIQVRKTFGPLHIEEIDILYREALPGPGEIGLGLDASLALAGLKVQADDLTLFVPLDAPGNLSRWKLDLSGLAVSMSNSSVSISGGLLKAEAAGTIEYRGSLSIQVAGRGLSALGAYARPTDSQGSYPSLFVFLAISAPLGGPPYLFVTGVAGGVGVNRRLLTPRDPQSVTSFPLVQAMDEAAPADPMQQLQRIGTDIPPSRGAFWLAAGVRFSTFELLRTTALLTVALDRGVEVTLLGLMRLNLPPAEGATIISLELALAAKYSSVDQVLSVQAALTNNSWLLSPNCRLTGGFAFVAWFKKPEVLLTVGGYSSRFPVPNYYPNVPRVGFHWAVTEGIVIKGEQFFALTHSAVMVGGALEASYDIAPIRAWFSAGLDVIVYWDPFHYEVSAHIEVGVEFKVTIEIAGEKVSLPSLNFRIGAWLDLQGPPLQGMLLVDIGIAKFPIPFGEKQEQAFLSWEEARDKYLGPGTAGTIAAGTVPAPKQPDGSADAPWFVSPQFVLRIESKMPASEWRLGGRTGSSPGAAAEVDVLPTGGSLGRVRAVLDIVVERKSGANWQALTANELAALDPLAADGRYPGAIWDGGVVSDGNAVDTSRGMLAGLGTLELSSALDVREATGQMADLAVASMIEEETPHALPFGPAAAPQSVPQPAPARPRMARVAPAATAATGAVEPVQAPHLRTALRAADDVAVRVPVAVRSARARSAAAPASVPLAAGAAQVWEIAVERVHRVKAAGAPRRVVALSGAGAVLCDMTAGARATPLPEGARTVVLADVSSSEVCGWELDTQLVRAGSGTYVAPGATLLLPRPWSPPALPGRRPQDWVLAAALAAAVDGITTRFAVAEGATPTTVVVRVDRRVARADLRRIEIDVKGAVLGKRSVVRHGNRIDISLPLSRLEAGATGVSITVHCGEDFRMAGVVGLRGAARRAAAGKGLAGHARLASNAAVSTRSAQVSLEPLPPRRKR